jgi:hypothetical protein
MGICIVALTRVIVAGSHVSVVFALLLNNNVVMFSYGICSRLTIATQFLCRISRSMSYESFLACDYESACDLLQNSSAQLHDIDKNAAGQ